MTRRTLRRSAWYAASEKLRAGGRLSAAERSLLRRRGMLCEEYRLSRRGSAAHLAALLGVPVLEVRALAVLYTFRRDLESASAPAPAHECTAPAPHSESTHAGPPAAAPAPHAPAAAPAAAVQPPPPTPPPPLPARLPVSYSALARVFAGRSPSRMRSAVSCLVRLGLAAKCGREHACITDSALARLSEFDEQIRSIVGGP